MRKIISLLFVVCSFTSFAQTSAKNAAVRATAPNSGVIGDAVDGNLSFTASGTDTYTITTDATYRPYAGGLTYAAGDIWTVNFTNANSSTTVTLNVDGEGAIAVKNNAGSDPGVGDIVAGGTYSMRYNGTNFRIIGATGGGGGGGLSDGDKGDLTVSGTGATWTIDNAAVTGAKIANDVTLAGNPTTTTQTQGNNSTRLATTAYVDVGLALKAAAFTETATIFVDSLGNDASGAIGRPDKPFQTINAALDAGAAVRSLKIFIGMGTFNAPDSAKLRGNLWLQGSGKPGYNNHTTSTAFAAVTVTDPTALKGGTILKGTLVFRNQKGNNVHLTDLGVDTGSTFVFTGGTEGNQIVFLSSHATAPWLLMKNIVIQNVTTLGRTAGSAFHGIQIENAFKPIIENCDTYFSTHGIVLKTYGGIVNNVRCNFHTLNAVIFKTDTYALGWINQLTNFEVQGGGGVRLHIGSGTSTGGMGSLISNGILRSPSFGIIAESSTASMLHYLQINNIKVYASSGIGIEVTGTQSSYVYDNQLIACTTGIRYICASTNNFGHVFNNLAESCTTGYTITGGSAGGNIFFRDNGARGNTTGAAFSGNVYGAGNDYDTNTTDQTGTITYRENARMFVGTITGSPTALLHVNSGSTTLAPLKIASGALLTTPEVSAIEFLTDKWYGTITTGAARKEFTLNDAALTSGRVPFATTNGRISDDSDLTFSGGNTLNTAQLTVGSGATITGHLSNSGTLNFGSIAAGASEILTLTVTGAADGNPTFHGVPNASMTQGLIFTSWVSATNTVSVQCYNSTAGAIDPASGTFRATVLKY